MQAYLFSFKKTTLFIWLPDITLTCVLYKIESLIFMKETD